MLDFFKTDVSIIVLFIINVVLFIAVIISNARINKINKNTKEFMRKLGTGRNIMDDINNYMERIIDIEKALSETNNYCKELENEIKGCVQKVGVVRYNAYKDSGSDLSFAVALLDDKNNGVVFNGIYSREMSNIYAKPITEGNSKYTLIEEEAKAVNKAMNSKD